MTHIIYRAQELGLGSCPVGSFHREKLKLFLGLPDSLEPILSLAVGYPAESPKLMPRKSLSEIVYRVV